MPLLLAVAFTTLALEDDDLPVTPMAEHFGFHRRARHGRDADLDAGIAIPGDQNVVEHDQRSGLGIERGHAKAGAGLGPKLLPTRLKDRVHTGFSRSGAGSGDRNSR